MTRAKITTPYGIAVSRIEKLIGWKYSGNLTEAAPAIGVSYWKLRRILRGESKLDLETLDLCSRHFDLTVEAMLQPDERGARR